MTQPYTENVKIKLSLLAQVIVTRAGTNRSLTKRIEPAALGKLYCVIGYWTGTQCEQYTMILRVSVKWIFNSGSKTIK